MKQSSLEPKISIRTPENVEIQYRLAGIGSRGLALIIDNLVQIATSIILMLVFIIINLFFIDLKRIFGSEFFESSPTWLIAILLIGTYLVRMGYFVLFETFWNGQTPGKKLLRIRTLKEDGYVAGFIEAMTRNLLRIVDILPGLYGVGIISIFISSKEKRIGDYVAGTIVVKEKIQGIPSPAEFKVQPAQRSFIDFGSAITKINKQESQIVKTFLQRRFELNATSRRQLAKKIASPLIEKLATPKPSHMSYEVFLISLLQAYEESTPFIE
jgi:uncharacterized RDD family membrane protein YckC